MADKKKKSPEEMEKAQKRQARQAKRRKKRKVRRIILTYLLTIFLLVGVIGGYVVYQKIGKNILAYREQAIEMVGNSSIDNFRRDETSTVYDSKGKKIREIKGEKEVYYKK